MKKISVTLVALALVSNGALAAPTKKKPTNKPAAAPAASAPTENPSYSYTGNSTGSGPKFSGGVSLGTINSNFMFGPTFTMDFPTWMDGNKFTFGAQTGIYFGSGTGYSVWSIPIMATGAYHFSNNNNIKPYVGLGMGISIDHTSLDAVVAGVSTSSTNVHFAILVKPGMTFGSEGKWFAELPIGSIFTGFALLPTFGYHFN